MLYEFDTVPAAKWYLKQVQPFCRYELEIKPEEDFRSPVHDFVLDNILRRFSI